MEDGAKKKFALKVEGGGNKDGEQEFRPWESLPVDALPL